MAGETAARKTADKPLLRDAEATRTEIIEAARVEFAAKGFAGARVDEIAARTRTTKPTIYYHFGSKEELFRIVLEKSYAGMRDTEQSLELDHLPAKDAMRRLVETSFDYHMAHPDWVRLVSIENILEARHIAGSPSIADRNAAVIEVLRKLLARGQQDGSFRTNVDPLDLHLMISSLCFYRVSNRHTWKAIFKRDLQAPKQVAIQKRMIVEAVERYLRP
jgi:AcrR family transcriptional regulator